MPRYDDDSPYVIVERRSGGSFSAFIWGAAIGAGLALLFAPRSGRETRQQLRDGVRRMKDAAEGTVRELQETVADGIEDVRRQVTQRLDAARYAVDAGRQAARETRADIERRVRDVKEAAQAGYDAARPSDAARERSRREPAEDDGLGA